MLGRMTVRVLVVDDQAVFRQAMRTVLELTEGFEVCGEAATGLRAVELATILDPDLVLMDVHLPGLGGFEATRRIIADAQSGRSRRVVLLSTYEAADYARLSAACGAYAYLSKSELDPDVLRSIWACVSGGVSSPTGS
jgi:DNA-binding NarL/FixJ family response regulator